MSALTFAPVRRPFVAKWQFYRVAVARQNPVEHLIKVMIHGYGEIGHRHHFSQVLAQFRHAVIVGQELTSRSPIVGIEYAIGLHEIAVRNVATYRSESRRCAHIEPLHGDALAYTLPPGPLLLFVFNALAEEIMRALLKKLDQQAAAQEGRPVLLIYTNIRSVREMAMRSKGSRICMQSVASGTLS
jgi:hypothetical protein